jgi:hypothetical protein
MLGRRRIDTPAPFRSSIANAAFAVEERVVWGGAEVLRRLAEAVKWPFERIIWAIERGLVWPLEERAADWGAPVRVLGVIALVLLAAGAGVLGLVWASGSGGGGTPSVREAAAPVTAPPIVRQAPQPEPAAAPVLQGAKPDFSAEADAGVAKSSGEIASSDPSTATSGSTAEVAKSASSGGGASTSPAGTASAKPAGPAASKVAQQFAGAFVLYEIGRNSAEVRKTFNETAAPQLTHELLQRPPRQPAGVEVPKAKVLNVVAGPHIGDTYTLSVSLLRVGVTSELRLEMQRDPKNGVWRVVGALG